MKPDQVPFFLEYCELRQNPELNEKRISELESLLVVLNEGLIYYAARRLPSLPLHSNEVLAVGQASLLSALRSFKLGHSDFGPYAVRALMHSDGLPSITRFHASGPIKIPNHAFLAYLKEKREQRADPEHELSEESQCVEMAMNYVSRLGENETVAGDVPLDEKLEQSTYESPLQTLAERQAVCNLYATLSTLEDRERVVLQCMFGLNRDEETLDLRSLGDKMGMSHENVRKIRERALGRMRKRLKVH